MVKAVPLPPGFRFVPTNAEIITEYLYRKVKGLPLSSDYAIIECDLYDGKDKWKEFFDKNPLDNKSLYFFTKLKKKTEKGVRIGRCTGSGGTWRETQKDKDIYSDDETSTLIGTKKSFKFVGATNSNFKWLMDEYRLHSRYLDQSMNEYVVCHIKCEKERMSSKSNSSSSNNIQAADSPNVPINSAGATLPIVEYSPINVDAPSYLIADVTEPAPSDPIASVTPDLIDSTADWTNIDVLEAYMRATVEPTTELALENGTTDCNSNYATSTNTFTLEHDDFGTHYGTETGSSSNLWTTSEELESWLMLPLETY